MIKISNNINISDTDITFTAIRAQGSGGQNVNKVSTAIHLRFDILASSLPAEIKEKLIAINDHRITKDGQIIIKAQEFKSLQKNREAAIARLVDCIQKATFVAKKRRPTRASKASKAKRMDSKTKRGQTKKLRKKIL